MWIPSHMQEGKRRMGIKRRATTRRGETRMKTKKTLRGGTLFALRVYFSRDVETAAGRGKTRMEIEKTFRGETLFPSRVYFFARGGD